MKKTMLITTILIFLFSFNTVGYVILYPGVEFYNNDLTVTFSNEDGINITYFEVGNKYIEIGVFNLTISCSNSIEINISKQNDNSVVYAEDDTILAFNATYTGSSVTFNFYGNFSNMNYLLYVDDIYSNTYTDNFSWTETSWTTHSYRIDGKIYPDPPYNGSSSYNSTANSFNLTWNRGNYSDTERLVKKTNGFSTDPMDGTLVQNSTTAYYDFNVTEDAYYTVWSYNTSSNTFSKTGLNIVWGALTINVFNASKTWEKISPFGLTIQNVAGTQIYTNTSASAPLNINLSDIPLGDNTVFIINASNYKTQTYRRDTSQNTFMNYTFLLPPKQTTTSGEGDIDPDTGEPTNDTDSQLYLITLYNEVDQTLQDGLITFSIYVNATDTYEQIGSFITDGAGQGTIWLVPNKLYKVICSVPGSDDYETNTSYWTPSNLVFTKVFKLRYVDDEPQEPYLPQEYITFTAIRSSSYKSMNITYLDSLGETLDTFIVVYEINITTGVESVFYTNITTNTNDFTLEVTGLNTSNSYKIALHYNHTTFGYQDPTILVAGLRIKLTSAETINNLLTILFGYNPLGWSHVIMFIILVLGMYFADPEDAGKILMILGGIFIFLNVFIGIDDALTAAAGGIIPGLFIIAGILIEWNNRKV